MEFRARETKLVAKIKQLEEQVSELKATEKAFEEHRHKSSILIHQLEQELSKLYNANRSIDRSFADHKDHTKSYKVMLDQALAVKLKYEKILLMLMDSSLRG